MRQRSPLQLAAILRSTVPVVQRMMLWSGRWGLRPVWSAGYAVATRGYTGYLCRAEPGAAAFLTGSSARDESRHGLSDIDVAIIVRPDLGVAGQARARVRARCHRVNRLLPVLGPLIFDWPRVYEDPDVVDVSGTDALTYHHQEKPGDSPHHAVYSGPHHDVDKVRLLERPGLSGTMGQWRLIRGPDRRPLRSDIEAPERSGSAWLELQYWWRWTFDSAANPDRLSSPYLAVKLVAEVARIWLWLARDQRVATRAETLILAARELPEEAPALTRIFELQRSRNRMPQVTLADALPLVLRLSERVAEVIAEALEPAGVTEVQLLGDPDALALPHGDWSEVTGASPGADDEPRVLPLLDWRALVCPGSVPDEGFVLIEADPLNPRSLAAVAALTDRGPYPTVTWGRLMLRPLPMSGRGRLRSVQCPHTDPVSFALVRGETVARFSNSTGCSIADVLRRAVREHSVMLTEPQCVSPPNLQAMGRLLTAARAAFAWEAAQDCSPTLPITIAATLDALRERMPGLGSELEAVYREAHVSWRDPPGPLLARFRQNLLVLPAYRQARVG